MSNIYITKCVFKPTPLEAYFPWNTVILYSNNGIQLCHANKPFCIVLFPTHVYSQIISFRIRNYLGYVNIQHGYLHHLCNSLPWFLFGIRIQEYNANKSPCLINLQDIENKKLKQAGFDHKTPNDDEVFLP